MQSCQAGRPCALGLPSSAPTARVPARSIGAGTTAPQGVALEALRRLHGVFQLGHLCLGEDPVGFRGLGRRLEALDVHETKAPVWGGIKILVAV